MSLPADLSRPLRATARRIRVQRALDSAVVLGLAALGLAALVLALLKGGRLSEELALRWLLGAGSLPVLGLALGALRPIGGLVPAKLLDRAHGLQDRLSNAAAFASEAAPTPFMLAAIEDARAHASGLAPSRALAFAPPRGTLPLFGLAAGLALLAMVEVPRVLEERLPPPEPGIVPVMLHPDDLDAFESELRDLLEDPSTPEDVRQAAQSFNRLVEDLADERLDRAETLRRIAELERQLNEARPAEAESLRDSLAQLGRDLTRASLAESLSQALRDGDAERSEAETRRLSERLRTDPPNRAELERLRQALQRAAQNQPEDRSEDLREREQEVERLLRRQREQAEPQPAEERRLLQRRQRELERLRREHQESMERRRQLDRLQRELQQAAESLQQQQRDRAAQDLERAAEDLNRMAREQRSDQELQRLQEQLSELRELIRRMRQQRQEGGEGQDRPNGQGGQGQSPMDRFVARARGQGEGEGVPLGVPSEGGGGQRGQQGGQDGQGQPGQQAGQGQPGQHGQGQPGQQGQGSGQGQAGEGSRGGQQGQRMLVLGGQGGDAILELPGMGRDQPGAGQGEGGARAQQGPGAGVGHDPTLLDDPTRLGGARQTVRVEGQPQGEGPSRSQTILSSAQRGFASRDYQRVYTDYSGHAEEVLERDQIPPGYRFYVRRYFQLIRPREGE